MLSEHESIFKLNDFDNSQWITFAVVTLLLILFVRLGLPLIKRFMRESRLLDEEISRQFREFYYAKFGPHFLARNSSPRTVMAVFVYLGLTFNWLFVNTFLSNVSFLLAALTLVMWKLDLFRRLLSNLRRFVHPNGLSGPGIDGITGMPCFQPDLMAETEQSWNTSSDSARHRGSSEGRETWQRIPASAESPDYTPGSSVRVH